MTIYIPIIFKAIFMKNRDDSAQLTFLKIYLGHNHLGKTYCLVNKCSFIWKNFKVLKINIIVNVSETRGISKNLFCTIE